MSGFRALSIASIPIHVTVWFVLLLAFWAMSERSILVSLIVMVAVAVSLLVHELGHGLVARRYRLNPSITLHGFGGLCSHRPAPTWRHDLAIILALCHELVNNHAGAIDADFINDWCYAGKFHTARNPYYNAGNNLAIITAWLNGEGYTAAWASGISGVPAADIEEAGMAE